MEQYWWTLPDDIDAFDYAQDFVGSNLLPDVGVIADNRRADVFEKQWFRPAVELQVAGICLMAGPLGDRSLAGSFTCFIIDHLLMGWNSLLVSHTRVAYTLSRHVIEAAIFAVASVASPLEFERLWRDNRATGGKALRISQRHIPSALAAMLEESWRFSVSFGHVSPIPAHLSKLAGAVPPAPHAHGVTFCGPHNGPLTKDVLFHLGGTFTMMAETSLYAFHHVFGQRLETMPEFMTVYSTHEARVAERKHAKTRSTRNA